MISVLKILNTECTKIKTRRPQRKQTLYQNDQSLNSCDRSASQNIFSKILILIAPKVHSSLACGIAAGNCQGKRKHRRCEVTGEHLWVGFTPPRCGLVTYLTVLRRCRRLDHDAPLVRLVGHGEPRPWLGADSAVKWEPRTGSATSPSCFALPYAASTT